MSSCKSGAQALVNHYVALTGGETAAMIRKSVETRDWCVNFSSVKVRSCNHLLPLRLRSLSHAMTNDMVKVATRDLQGSALIAIFPPTITCYPCVRDGPRRLASSEPRMVRAVMRRVVEDVTAMDSYVSLFFDEDPSAMRASGSIAVRLSVPAFSHCVHMMDRVRSAAD